MTQARPKRVEYQQTDRGVVPVHAKGTVLQPYEEYGPEDHGIWSHLMQRQDQVLANRACSEWIASSRALGLSVDRIPRFSDLNDKLGPATGWKVVGVEGLVSSQDFYTLLVNREFPVTWWIRSKDQLDYLPEPDLFHDAYGHVPLLMLPVYADYIQNYAAAALRVLHDPPALEKLSRLSWYTVEFGLLGPMDAPRIYGAGIMSSAHESVHCLEGAGVERLPFDPDRIMAEPFQIDRVQQKYFVVEDLQTLYRSVKPILEAF